VLLLLRAQKNPLCAQGAGFALAALWFTKDLAKVFVALAVLGAPWLLAKRRLLTTALFLSAWRRGTSPSTGWKGGSTTRRGGASREYTIRSGVDRRTRAA
jgi:uncharacterized membrane protein YgcG